MRISNTPAGRAPARALLCALLVLLGLASAERATAQTCLQSTQTTTVSTDTTKKGKHKKPKRRAPRDGAGVQVTEPGCGSDITPPTVTITPGSGGQGSPLSVTIDWQDDVGLDQYAHWITLNGVDVTSSFNYSGSARWATSTGTLTLQAGNNTLTAEIWDQAGNWNYAQVTYSHTPPSAAIPAPAPLPEATAGATPSLREVVRGIYRQVLEREADPGGLDSWTANFQNGWTVQQMVRAFATSQEHYDRFVAGRPGRVAAASMYRHLFAREAEPGELDYWGPVVDGGGWVSMVDGLMGHWTYAEWFGEHAVPGRPVSLWDSRRAGLVLEPATGYADGERDLCLTVAVPGGAYECGDLRLAHALPAIRALNKARQPVLLYSSQQAHPMPIVAARVTLPGDRGTPERVDAVLRVGPRFDQLTERARRSWAGSEWAVGQARQIALSYDAAGDAQGFYDYSLEVVATYPGGSTQRWVQRGSRALVNRRESPFGAGWWMAGLEQIVRTSNGGWLWVGGDGSTRVYEPLAGATNVWVARTPDQGQDTLRWSSYNLVWTAAPSAGSYERRLPGGARVYFDVNTGLHSATSNRLDHHTHFVWDGPRLTALHVPTAAGYYAYKPSYRFNYGAGGPHGRLYTVTSPDLNDTPGRQVVLGPHNGDSRVWTIQDPDGKYVELAYWEPGRPEVVNRRTDRRRASWGAHYFYGAGGKLEKVNLDMGGDGEADDLITRFVPAETRALGAPVAPQDVHTFMDGPRTDANDHTRLWLDRFGAPWRVVDAGNNETILTRSDLRHPALVTRTDGPVRIRPADFQPERQTVSASYDERGNVQAQTDWSTSRVLSDGTTAYATVRYAYENTAWPDFVTRITQPEGDVTRMDYHANGNRAWQQPGDDASRRVNFGYNGQGLPETVTHAAVDGQTATEVYEYDGRGNLHRTRTPSGHWTTQYLDALGRTWKTESPIDGANVQVHENTFYPNTDDVEYSRTIGPTLNGVPSQTLTSRTTYDEEGNQLTVARRSDPDPNNIGWITTQFRYDPAGRRVAEIAPDGQVDSTYYDFAGNVVRARTRRGASITMQYDALNRLTQRVTPEVRYAQRVQGITTRQGTGDNPAENSPFPRYANDGGTGYLIPGDVASFGYDQAGRMIWANNGDAQVSRTYYLNGLLKSETQQIRTLHGGDFGQHVYEVGVVYDLSSRRVEVKHPAQLAPSPAQASTRYAYKPATGELATVTDALGNQFHFDVNARGELKSLRYPGGITESYGYDPDGNLLRHQVQNQSTSAYKSSEAYLRHTTFSHDRRGKILHTGNLYGSRDTLVASYSGLGHAIGGGVISHGWGHVPPCYNTELRSKSGEQMRYDALGNLNQTATADTLWFRCGTQRRAANDRSWGYVQGTGRLAWTQNLYQRDTTYFDAAGNAEFETQTSYVTHTSGAVLRDRASYYGADGKLRAADSRMLSDPSVVYGAMFSTTFEEYRYDALGRRVWVRARRYCDNDPQQFNAECNLDKVRRTVWDGDHELYEIQMPGQDGSPHLENDVNLVVLPMDATGGGYAVDPNPFYGRTAYTHGAGVDRPLDVIRIGYGDQVDENSAVVPHRSLPPFAIMPLWSARGQADLGVFADGGLRKCEVRDGTTRCVYNNWPGSWFANERPKFRPSWWHGSMSEDKKDAAGTFYRRNRYLDAQTGRFTQEDPIGLAGGMNLYGFAGGDPVNYDDPFGLCPVPPTNCADAAMAVFSVGKFIAAPSLGTGIDAALDVAGALPGVPSVGVIRRVVGGADNAADAARTMRRPGSFRRGTVQRAWDNAAPGPNGGRLCPTCGREVRVAPGQGRRDWDVDHQPAWSRRNVARKTRKEVLDDYNSGTRLECPSCNRSRGARDP